MSLWNLSQRRKSAVRIFLLFALLLFGTTLGLAQDAPGPTYTIFDDKALLDGYANKYAQEPKETLLAIIKDDSLSPYESAAAIRVFRERFGQEVFAGEKRAAEKILLLRMNRTDSTFVQIEAMHALCLMDRYKYFGAMIPALIQELDHYNTTANELAFKGIDNIIKSGHNRPREARIVFNTLRKIFFLSRKKLQNVKEPGPKLKQKLELLRWSIKILGSQELKKLPSEIINLL